MLTSHPRAATGAKPVLNDASLRALRIRLRSLSTGPELLYDLMAFGPYREMAMTRDGMLVARPRRSPGFDVFVGKPSRISLERTARLWLELDEGERDLVLTRLALLRISPIKVGIPRTAISPAPWPQVSPDASPLSPAEVAHGR